MERELGWRVGLLLDWVFGYSNIVTCIAELNGACVFMDWILCGILVIGIMQESIESDVVIPCDNTYQFGRYTVPNNMLWDNVINNHSLASVKKKKPPP